MESKCYCVMFPIAMMDYTTQVLLGVRSRNKNMQTLLIFLPKELTHMQWPTCKELSGVHSVSEILQHSGRLRHQCCL